MEKEAVANTSSLLFLAKLKRLDLVKSIFFHILIPKQVLEEIFSKNKPENIVIKNELREFLKEIEVKQLKDFTLDKGEKAAISLCLEKNIKTFISDDKKARKIARSLEIETLGLVGIILHNLEISKITKKEALKLIEELIKNGYYMSSSLYTKVIQVINT